MINLRNFDLARLFHEMATLLEVHDESRFRVRAYQRAAQTLEALAEDVTTIAARGELQKLPGVGRDLAGRIDEYLRTGRIAQLETLRGSMPPSFLGLLEIRGLGPRTAKLLLDHLELGLGVARRAWLTPAHVLNTRSLDDLLAWTAAR